ncbi:polysaccharide deacetylase family protein, partial [Patulibacter sp. S7RM1-6]
MSRTADLVRVLDGATLRRAARRLGRWPGVLILTLHRVGDPRRSPLHRPLYGTDAAGLDAQLDVLEREAEVVPLSVLDGGGPRGLGRRVALTFDDGYRDTAEVAWPRLRARGLPATLFLATGFLDHPRLAWWDELAWMGRHGGWDEARIARLCGAYAALPADRAPALLDEVAVRTGTGRAPAAAADGVWMTWAQAARLRDEGMAIGGHTVAHPVLSRVDDATLAGEVAGCAATLRDRLGVPMTDFAVPLGGPADVDRRLPAALVA